MTITDYLEIAPKLSDINWFAFADQTVDAFKKRIELAKDVLALARKHNPELANFISGFGLPTMRQELKERESAPEACRSCPGLMLSWIKNNPGCGGCDPEIFNCEHNAKEA